MTVIPLHVMPDPVDPEAIDVWVDATIGDVPCRFRLDTGAGTCRVPTTEVTGELAARGTSPGVAARFA